MLYHSKLTYGLKWITGRKNEAWYFDRMMKDYPGSSIRETLAALSFGEELAVKPDETLVEAFAGKATNNPVFERTASLRLGVVRKEENSLKHFNFQIIFHTPPGSFSPGFASWFSSLGETMEWMGIKVHHCWDIWDVQTISAADVIVTHSNLVFVRTFPYQIIQRHKKNKCRILSFFGFDGGDEVFERTKIESSKKIGVDGFINPAHIDFLKGTSFAGIARSQGLDLFSMEFAANPLRHSPPPLLFNKSDFIFLASANYEKARRNHDFLYQPMTKQKGIIAGQGWPWISEYFLSPKRDRWMYSQSAIGLNIHLQSQVNEPTELNERTYILFATGIPQLLDNPALLDLHFPDYEFKASHQRQYFKLLLSMLYDKMALEEVAINMLEKVIEKHSTFIRVRQWLEQIGLLGQPGIQQQHVANS